MTIDDLAVHSEVLPERDFEQKFRYYYADLYPDESTLRKAIKYYQMESFGFPEVDPSKEQRLEHIRWWFRHRTTEELMTGPPKLSGYNYLFSDLPGIIGDSTVDIVQQKSAVGNPGYSFFYGHKGPVDVAKCLTALQKNNISIGNFSTFLWQGGTLYLDALEMRVKGLQEQTFTIIRAEPTYERPILIVTSYVNEGRMLGECIHHMNDHGVGALFTDGRKNIPGFYFVGSRQSGMIDHTLDNLSYF
ncbi:MAG: hypothetical protein ABIF10_06110 [Candidatus Woesearchaeota archaeon]